MPASGYFHYKDPETGEVTLLPDISGKSFHFQNGEFDELVKRGIIPEELVNSFEFDVESSNEIMERVKNGEQLRQEDVLEIHKKHCKNRTIEEFKETSNKKKKLTDFLTSNKGLLYGEKVLDRIFDNLRPIDPDVVWCAYVKEAIESISSKDPLAIHFLVARTYLKEKHSIEDSSAVDMLARGILNHCNNIAKFKTFKHKIFEKTHIRPEDLNEHFEDEKECALSLDIELLNYAIKIDVHSKKELQNQIKQAKECYKDYKAQSFCNEMRPHIWGLWIRESPNGEAKTISPFLNMIAESEWKGNCSSIFGRQKQSPALTKPIIENVKQVFKPKEKKKYTEKEGQVICSSSKGEPLILAPAVDSSLIQQFKKGVRELGTLTGHKVLRWQVKTGFENWAKNNKDPRLITINGGYGLVTELIGASSRTDIGKVKDILHAQAYGRFIFPNGSHGNMIAINIYEKHRNGEPSKIQITLGSMLLPDYVFSLPKNQRLLIPIGDLPPLYGSPNTHAAQAQLQLLFLEELTNQSDRYSEKGCALITMERWKEMAYEAGITNSEKVSLIIEHWCQPDLVNCFIDRYGDEYALTSYYERQEQFLIEQGKRRAENSKRGKFSISKKTQVTKKEGNF